MYRDKEKQKETRKEYQERNRKKITEQHKDWKLRNWERHTNYMKCYNLKKSYNLTLEEYEEILKKQEYKCKICKADIKGRKKAQIEHNHKTNKVRGILCVRCNTAIGLFKENIETMKLAIEYLQQEF